MYTRRALLSRFSLVTALSGVGSLSAAGYATAVEPHWVRETQYRITPANWPAGLRMRIAMLTDFHAHPRNMNEADLRRIVARTNTLRPDLVVLLGDYGSQERDPIAPETVASILTGLSAPRGVYAIQGNHDWTDDPLASRAGRGPTRVERAFRAAGIPFLDNEALPLGTDAPVWIAGIESEDAPDERGIPVRYSRDVDAYRMRRIAAMLAPVPADASVIFLAHEPDVFANDLDPRIALTLSGHTHGGQIRILGWSPWIPSRYGLRYAYGHIVERGRDLVVSAGLGSHFVGGVPLRIGVPPEIVVVDVGGEPLPASA